MRIATWNVNSIKARLPTVLEVLGAIDCDVVCLQELKCETDGFPYMELEELGWTCAVHGQKSYNGVAILSKYPLDDIRKGLSTMEDDQSRYIEALVMADTPIRVGGIYLPNGNPAPGQKFDYKLEWREALAATITSSRASGTAGTKASGPMMRWPCRSRGKPSAASRISA